VAAKFDNTPVPDFAGQLRLSGRVFVVLGAGNGIGRQVSHALAQAGAKVGCVDRDPDLAKHVAPGPFICRSSGDNRRVFLVRRRQTRRVRVNLASFVVNGGAVSA
jgi:NAD(P)-dependent dehydrogenase (short-subunit alcohol dehydrogenase family)